MRVARAKRANAWHRICIGAERCVVSKARLEFEYWRDPVNFPDLKMTPLPGGVNFAETGK